MFVELGQYAVILALIIAVLQSVIPMVGAQKGWTNWMSFAGPAAQMQFVLVALSFAALTYAFVVSDFSVKLVADNSNTNKPMIFKITGVWANHEGSILLWNLILAMFGALVATFGNNLPPALKARVLSVQAMIGVAFLGFLLFTSNPFIRLDNPPINGSGLNPLLQDFGLALHPPFLYFGYVGLSMAFSFAIAALIEGKVDAAWARWVRPWTLAAWVSLTIGISYGSWWAYYELGWGGWWFWDPVENSSFMPWLVATALLHSAIVVEKRDTLKAWTVLLAILAFSFSLLGTFLVRSGVLTSVHAFANDPKRGMYVLAILALAIGGGLTMYALRANMLRSQSVFSTFSRESGLVLNNLLLTVSATVVLVGTMWPLVIELITGENISVGPPFFNVAVTPFLVILVMVLPIGSILAWKRAKLGRAMQPLWGVVALSVVLGSLVWSLQTGGRLMAPIGLTLSAWVILGAIADLGHRCRFLKVPMPEFFRRLRSLPGSDWGRVFSHGGLGLMVFGISAVTAWELEDVRSVEFGVPYDVGSYTFTLNEVVDADGPNYTAQIGEVTVEEGDRTYLMYPEKRNYTVERIPTTEAAIDMGLTRDVYITLGVPVEDTGYVVRTYIKPFVNWIWIGTIAMAIGGLFSLFDRRYRIAAPSRKTAPASAAPAE